MSSTRPAPKKLVPKAKGVPSLVHLEIFFIMFVTTACLFARFGKRFPTWKCTFVYLTIRYKVSPSRLILNECYGFHHGRIWYRISIFVCVIAVIILCNLVCIVRRNILPHTTTVIVISNNIFLLPFTCILSTGWARLGTQRFIVAVTVFLPGRRIYFTTCT